MPDAVPSPALGASFPRVTHDPNCGLYSLPLPGHCQTFTVTHRPANRHLDLLRFPCFVTQRVLHSCEPSADPLLSVVFVDGPRAAFSG